MTRKAIKIVLLFACIAFLLLFTVFVADAANDVAASGVSNNTAISLTAVFVEYSNLSISTGTGNTSVIISAVVSTNSTQAKLYGRVKRDGIVIERINFSQSVYPEVATFVVPVVETEATHIYTFEAYCTLGRLCTIWNRTFSVMYLNTGSFGSGGADNTSINPYNVNASNLTSGTIPSGRYGTGIYTTNISDYSAGTITNATVNPYTMNASNLSSGTIPSTRYGTGIYTANISDGVTNITIQITRSQVTGQEGVDTTQNVSKSALQANDSYFNGTAFPQSIEFKNSTAVTANNTANLANTTANNVNATVAGNLVNWNVTYNTSYDVKLSNVTAGDNISITWSGCPSNCVATINSQGGGGSSFNATYDATTNTVNGNLANWNTTYNASYDAKPTLDTVNNSAQISEGQVTGLVSDLSGKEPAISQGVSPQLWVFNKTWQNITTTWITEGVNLWFTAAKVRANVSNGTSGNLTYSSSTGIFDLAVPTCSGTDKLTSSDGKNFTCAVDQNTGTSAGGGINVSGQPVITENASLVQGANITLTQSGNNITIASVVGSQTVVTNQTIADGVTQNYTLPSAFVANSTRVYWNGLRARINVTYTENTATQTMNFSGIPESGGVIEVEYIES